MAYISLPEDLPGMQALLRYHPPIASPLLQLMQVLMRGEGMLTLADRELLATAVSAAHHCDACSTIHGAVAANLSGRPDSWVHAVCSNEALLPQPLRNAMVLGKSIARREYGRGQAEINELRLQGTDPETIHDIVLIAALFTLFNKYIDGLGVKTEDTEESIAARAAIIASQGYHLTKQTNDGLD